MIVLGYSAMCKVRRSFLLGEGKNSVSLCGEERQTFKGAGIFKNAFMLR